MPSTRDALLDAAADAALAGDWARTRMADVARAAGVSRQTLYYEFGSKDRLAEALAMREAQRYIAGAEAAYAGHEDRPAEAIGAASEYTLRVAAANPLLKAVLTDDAGGLLPFLTTRGDAILAAASTSCADYLCRQRPDLPRDELRRVAELVVRLTLSHLVLPGRRPDEVAAELAHLVDRLLAPAPAQPQGDPA
ncbi:MAG TPA: TetR family transcriptional regulator [Mycobacteriales bacterium]|jgi:AcrR family transcriptional regulator|nr:TetR family transcriptional regulator [Mycobacteriales bacterium]